MLIGNFKASRLCLAALMNAEHTLCFACWAEAATAGCLLIKLTNLCSGAKSVKSSLHELMENNAIENTLFVIINTTQMKILFFAYRHELAVSFETSL